MGELPLGAGLLVARRAGCVVRVFDGRDLVAGVAVGALRRVDKGEFLARCVAGLAFLGLRSRLGLVVTRLVTAGATGLTHVVAARAPFGRVSHNVGDAPVNCRDPSTQRRPPWRRVQDARLGERGIGHRMTGRGVAAATCAAFGMLRMVEAGLGGDLLVARDAALVGNGRDRGEREDRFLGDMHPEFLHGDNFVG